MTFLELVQETARERGTVASVPSGVLNQTDAVQDVVSWVREAWIDIQNFHGTWQWMRRAVTFTTQAEVQTYSPAAMGEPRIRSIIEYGDDGLPMVTLNDAGSITYLYPEYWTTLTRLRGSEKPTRWAMDPQGRMMLGPCACDAYDISLIARLTPQVLMDGDDVPEMPEHHHRVIVLRALMKGGNYDEAFNQMSVWNAEYKAKLGDLMREQLPTVTRV